LFFEWILVCFRRRYFLVLNGFWCASVGIIVLFDWALLFFHRSYCFFFFVWMGSVVFPSEWWVFEWVLVCCRQKCCFLLNGFWCLFRRNYCFLNGLWCVSVGILVFWLDYGVFPSELLCFEWVLVCFRRKYCCLNGFWCVSVGVVVIFWMASGVLPSELLFVWKGSGVFPSELFFVYEWGIVCVPSELLFCFNGFLCASIGLLLLFCFVLHGFWCVSAGIRFVFWMDDGLFPSEVLFFEWVLVCFRRN